MWTFKISTGQMFEPNGAVLEVGYSGAPLYKNNPDCVREHNLGPIPPGEYEIGPCTDTQTHGPRVMALTPKAETDTFGRGGFLIHGDSIANPGTASHGCIILYRTARAMIAESKDRVLQVIP